MAKELRIIGDTTGQTLTANIYLSTDGSEHTVSLTESPTLVYTGTFPAIAAGTYDVAYRNASNQNISGETIVWSGTAVVTGGTVSLDPSVAAEIDAIKAKTDLIDSNGITVVIVSPIATDGSITLINGDDYLAADNRALSFAFTGVANLTASTVNLVLVYKFHPNTKHTVIGSITSPSSNPTVSFDVGKAITALLNAGDPSYDYAVVATLADGSVATLQRGSVTVIA